MRVLLIEDEKELARALAKMLTKDDYDVDCVHDGADGLNFASSGMYDLILLDVIMPKMNGFEVLSEIRRRKLETPVIMLTALADENDKILGLDNGADEAVFLSGAIGEDARGTAQTGEACKRQQA